MPDIRSLPPLPDNYPHYSFDQGPASPQHDNLVVGVLDVLIAFPKLLFSPLIASLIPVNLLLILPLSSPIHDVYVR